MSHVLGNLWAFEKKGKIKKKEIEIQYINQLQL